MYTSFFYPVRYTTSISSICILLFFILLAILRAYHLNNIIYDFKNLSRIIINFFILFLHYSAFGPASAMCIGILGLFLCKIFLEHFCQLSCIGIISFLIIPCVSRIQYFTWNIWTVLRNIHIKDFIMSVFYIIKFSI